MLRIAMLGGFLGAGKTTTMVAVARRLEAAGERVAIITNDQGADLVDTDLARNTTSAAVAEVTGGCFCCRFDDLAATIARVRDETDPSIVLAEAVGSCTDLQSTVVRPLRHLQGADVTVAPLLVVLDPLRYQGMCRQWLPLADEADLAYLYRHQLDEADIIAVNKTDLLADAEVARLRAEIGERYPAAAVAPISAVTGAGIDPLIALWMRGNSRARRPFVIDYDRYAEAEASLAWANRTFTLRAGPDAPLYPPVWADRMLDEFTRAERRIGRIHRTRQGAGADRRRNDQGQPHRRRRPDIRLPSGRRGGRGDGHRQRPGTDRTGRPRCIAGSLDRGGECRLFSGD